MWTGAKSGQLAVSNEHFKEHKEFTNNLGNYNCSWRTNGNDE